MKIVVTHGETRIEVRGGKSLKKMKNVIADIFESLPEIEAAEEPNPIGFTTGIFTEVEEDLE